MTLDDGYRDNKEWAYPIFRRQEVPFAIYVPTSFPDRLGQLWWLALEQAIANTKSLAFELGDQTHRVTCASVAEKREAFAQVYWWLRSLPSNEQILGVVAELADATASIPRRCATSLHDLERDRRARAGSAGDDRRPHRQPRHPGEILRRRRAGPR